MNPGYHAVLHLTVSDSRCDSQDHDLYLLDSGPWQIVVFHLCMRRYIFNTWREKAIWGKQYKIHWHLCRQDYGTRWLFTCKLWSLPWGLALRHPRKEAGRPEWSKFWVCFTPSSDWYDIVSHFPDPDLFMTWPHFLFCLKCAWQAPKRNQ